MFLVSMAFGRRAAIFATSIPRRSFKAWPANTLFYQVHKLCQSSADNILTTFHPNLMIAIGGGGYVPARILRYVKLNLLPVRGVCLTWHSTDPSSSALVNPTFPFRPSAYLSTKIWAVVTPRRFLGPRWLGHNGWILVLWRWQTLLARTYSLWMRLTTLGPLWNMRFASFRRMLSRHKSSLDGKAKRRISLSSCFMYVILGFSYSQSTSFVGFDTNPAIEQEQVQEGSTSCGYDGIRSLSCCCHNWRCLDLLSMGSQVCDLLY